MCPCRDIQWFRDTPVGTSFINEVGRELPPSPDNERFLELLGHMLTVADGDDVWLLDAGEPAADGEYPAYPLTLKYGVLLGHYFSFSALFAVGRSEIEESHARRSGPAQAERLATGRTISAHTHLPASAANQPHRPPVSASTTNKPRPFSVSPAGLLMAGRPAAASQTPIWTPAATHSRLSTIIGGRLPSRPACCSACMAFTALAASSVVTVQASSDKSSRPWANSPARTTRRQADTASGTARNALPFSRNGGLVLVAEGNDGIASTCSLYRYPISYTTRTSPALGLFTGPARLGPSRGEARLSH